MVQDMASLICGVRVATWVSHGSETLRKADQSRTRGCVSLPMGSYVGSFQLGVFFEGIHLVSLQGKNKDTHMFVWGESQERKAQIG